MKRCLASGKALAKRWFTGEKVLASDNTMPIQEAVLHSHYGCDSGYVNSIKSVVFHVRTNPDSAYISWKPSKSEQERLENIRQKFGQISGLPQNMVDLSSEAKRELSYQPRLSVPRHFDFENISESGYSSAFGYVARCNYEMVVFLLELGVSPNGPAGDFWRRGMHPLIDVPMLHISKNGRINYYHWLNLVRIFLEYGFDLNARIAEEGPLCYHPIVAENLLPNDLEYFLEKGFNPHRGFVKGKCFLHLLETNLVDNQDLIKLCRREFRNFPSAITSSANADEIQSALQKYQDPDWEPFPELTFRVPENVISEELLVGD
eukprot:TRINITY_DN11989_c0_g1_i1.p1 TRINITY_DN11989_c0_g1~~TRINITY_DN11989_c0_g1_i1.p1  ORF type:complete len:362 (-),score=56.96 TRINITY_DN11989_c0_g1_i1:235-1191(-)